MEHSVGKEPSFLLLPMELHLRIRNELLKDPHTNFSHFKTWRLVCKTFDLVWAPIVLVNLLLFPDNPIRDLAIDRLSRLIEGKHSSYAFKTVTLKNWHCLNSGAHHFFGHLWKLWDKNWKLALIQIPLILFLALPVNAIMLFGEPKILPRRLKTFSNLIRARCCASLLPHKLHLPNVSGVRLFIHSDSSRWEIHRTARFFLMLPDLTELELRLWWDADMPYISRCLKPLRNLQKFTLQIRSRYNPSNRLPSKLGCFGLVIARNPNITHLSFRSTLGFPCDLSQIMRNVPTEKPLKLEHVTIDGYCTNIDALLPHIQSLSSLEVYLMHTSENMIYTVLERAGVFPPMIITDSFELELCLYLEHHPGVVSLLIGHNGRPGALHDYGLAKVLTRHSGTLQRLSVRSHMLYTADDEVALSGCAHLRELVLTQRIHRMGLYDNIYNEIERILSTAARFSRSLIVVISCPAISTFQSCVEYCRKSENLLLRDLAGRIVYERPSDH
ncbi:hypothetical protein JOM56_006960 [Amanita muscaria]